MCAARERCGMAENANDRFERLAEAFRVDTGFIAPGKSIPDAMGFTDEKGRWDAWETWLRSDRALAMRDPAPPEPSRVPGAAPEDYEGDVKVFLLDDGERHWYAAKDAGAAIHCHVSLMDADPSDEFKIKQLPGYTEIDVRYDDEYDVKDYRSSDLFMIEPPDEDLDAGSYHVVSSAAGWAKWFERNAPEQICSSVF